MTPVFSVRRRAEEFESLIGGMPGTDLADARYAEFTEIVRALREVPAVRARPAFVADLRERLMLAAGTDLAPAPGARLPLPARRPRDRRIAAAVGGFAIVGATTSMAMAAQTALPGDVLYPLKRAIENVETGITVNEGDKGAILLANASGRLAEVSALSRAGRLEDTGAIADTLDTFTEQSTAASDLLLSDYARTGDESSIADLRDFTAASIDTLAGLESVVPSSARDELLHAAQVLTQIDARAQQACPTCGGDGIDEIPRILAEAVGYTSGVLAVDVATRVPGVPREAGPGKGRKQRPDLTPSSGGHSALPPASVLDTEDTDGPARDGGGPGEAASDEPMTDLTHGLAPGGGDQPASSPTGLPGAPAGSGDPVAALERGLEDLEVPAP